MLHFCLCVVLVDTLPLQRLEVVLPLTLLSVSHWLWGVTPLAWPPLWFRFKKSKSLVSKKERTAFNTKSTYIQMHISSLYFENQKLHTYKCTYIRSLYLKIKKYIHTNVCSLYFENQKSFFFENHSCSLNNANHINSPWIGVMQHIQHYHNSALNKSALLCSQKGKIYQRL